MIAGELSEGNAVRLDSVFVSESDTSSTIFRTGMRDAGTGRGRRGSPPGPGFSEIVFGELCKGSGDEKDEG